MIIFLASGLVIYSNFDNDDKDSDYGDDESPSDGDISEFCDTVTEFSNRNAATLTIINGGYYDQDSSLTHFQQEKKDPSHLQHQS